MDRRGFLAGIGLVGAGAVVGTGLGVLAEPAIATESPTARTARPGGQLAAFTSTVAFRTAPSQRLVALTIDDGPTATWTPQVLAMLQRRGAAATFFVVGKRLDADRTAAKQAVDAGHELGNHTWAHTDLTHLDEMAVRDSLERTHAAITAVSGRPPTLCRPPYGRIDSVGLGACAALGYDVALWSDHITGSNATGDVDTTLRQVSPGSIVLAHDGGPEPNPTLMAQLDRLVGSMLDAGYRFVTLSALLAAPPAIPAPRRPLD